jgi:hypothetical protein
VSPEKMTTDDPLATIQVHPINTKKSLKSSPSNAHANEIYAVSRFDRVGLAGFGLGDRVRFGSCCYLL